jgi:sugar O-acyltransferase (sialic acid O-acetyltransferase NeuD family)
MNVIFGSAGFAKELDWLIYEIAEKTNCNFTPDYFVSKTDIGQTLNGKKIISEEEFFTLAESGISINVFLGVGSPFIKEKIYNNLLKYNNMSFPNLIHPNAIMDKREGMIQMGFGNIFFPSSVLTSHIKIGNFVLLYLDCSVGHDTNIGNFTTISPGCHISGNVKIGKTVYFGTGSVTVERIDIQDYTIIGAGATVIKSITDQGTYVGTPAKKIK